MFFCRFSKLYLQCLSVASRGDPLPRAGCAGYQSAPTVVPARVASKGGLNF